MSPKLLRTLLALLAALALWVLVVERPFVDDIRGPSGSPDHLFGDFDPDADRRNSIHTPSGVTHLEREGDAWVVVGDVRFRADAQAVKDLLARVDTLAIATVASTNPEKRGVFGVDSSGVAVTIADAGGAALARFRVGNATPDFSGLFLRPEDANEVYAVPGINRFHFDRGGETWRDRTLVATPAEEVRRLSVSWGDTTVTLVRVGDDSLDVSTWRVAGNRPDEPEAPALAAAAHALVRGVTGLRVDGFPTAADTVPAAWDIAWRFEVESRSGAREVVEVGSELVRGQQVVRRADGPGVSLVGPWRFTRFQRRWSDLRDPAAAEADAAAPAAAP